MNKPKNVSSLFANQTF